MPKRRYRDDEEPIFLLNPTENVYSFFMFIAPTDQARRKKQGAHITKESVTWDILIGYVLAALNFTLQGILLYTLFTTIITDNVEWQNGIYKVGGQSWNLLAAKDTSKCNDGGSLCMTENGKYSCAPPSVQLTGRWDELDTDGDGIWTREEVVAKKDELKCKYAVNPIEVFDVFINFLKQREDIIWLHPDVQAGKAVHLPYFKYAMGDIVMCGYRSKPMCANLLKQGFFHAALKYGTAPRVGTQIDDALRYCHKLLSPGGICDKTLPSTYSVWKIESEAQCGSPSYDKFTYVNPGNNVTKSLLSVDYQARQDYELSQTLGFRAYKAVILMLWLVGMSLEVREIYLILTLVGKYPDAEQFGDDAVLEEADPADPEDVRYRILGIDKSHRIAIGVLSVLRLAFTLILAYVGMVFLLRQIDYIDLLLDGVALIYIVEIAGVLYSQILREEVRDQTEDIKAMRVEMYGIDYLNRRPALIDIMTLCAIMAVTIFVMEKQLGDIIVPVYEALECTCIKTGPKCVEALKFDFDFWYKYWKITVPAILTEVAELKANPAAHAVKFHAVTAGSMASAATYVAGHPERLLNSIHHVKHKLSSKSKSKSRSSVVKPPKFTSDDMTEEEYVEAKDHHGHNKA
jgi:hypothetical protein